MRDWTEPDTVRAHRRVVRERQKRGSLAGLRFSVWGYWETVLRAFDVFRLGYELEFWA